MSPDAWCFLSESSAFKALPIDQLIDVLSAPLEERQDLLIGGMVDRESGLATFVKGDLERVAVTLDRFRASAAGRPNFGKLEFDDYGHTVRFGDYEAATDFVLYESSPGYRRRLNARRRAEEGRVRAVATAAAHSERQEPGCVSRRLGQDDCADRAAGGGPAPGQNAEPDLENAGGGAGGD